MRALAIMTHLRPIDVQNIANICGILYCVAPIADLNGNSSISFADFKFTGRLEWETTK